MIYTLRIDHDPDPDGPRVTIDTTDEVACCTLSLTVSELESLDLDGSDKLVDEVNAHGLAVALRERFGWTLSAAEARTVVRYETVDPDLWRDSDADGEEVPRELHPALKRARYSGKLILQNHVAREPFFVGQIDGLAEATAEHKIALSATVRQWAKDSYPSDLWVVFPLRDLAAILYADRGGWEFERVQRLLEDLADHRSTVRHGEVGNRFSKSFCLVQGYELDEAAGHVRVQLGAEFARKILELQFKEVDPATIRALRVAAPRSDTARLLWMWLESESLKPWFKRRVFAAAEGKTAAPDAATPVAAVLGLHGSNRRKVVGMIRKAADLVMSIDPRYTITVTSAAERGQWNLEASRVESVKAPAAQVESDDDEVLAGEIVDVQPWRSDSNAVADGDGSFDVFWNCYPRNENRKGAYAEWLKLNDDERRLATAAAQQMGEARGRGLGPERRWIKHAATWLKGACWDDWSDGEGQQADHATAAPSPPLGPVEVDEARVAFFEGQIKVH